jgi:hypothetical protein
MIPGAKVAALDLVAPPAKAQRLFADGMSWSHFRPRLYLEVSKMM